MNLNRVMHEIKYAYAKMEAFNEYYDVNVLLLETILNNKLNNGEILNDIYENGKNGVHRAIAMLYDYIKGERKIISGLKSGELILPEKAKQILQGIKTEKQAGILYASFPLEGQFNVVIKKQRGAVFKADNITIKPHDNKFLLINPMAVYGNENYSIAFRSFDESFGFAIMYGPSITGAKGKNMLKVSYFDPEAYYIDDASKYRNASEFGEGID